MGFVQDILALVLPGALFNLVAHSARLRLRRVEGYALLFYTLLVGWVIQGATGLANDLLLIALEWMGFAPIIVLEAGTFQAAAISGGLLVALFAAAAVNWVWRIDHVSRQVAGESGEFRELTYQLAIATTSLVEVTLETGKSYVGVPVASRVAMENDDDLWLVLVMSGYRDGQQELRITTSYAAKQDDELMAGRGLPLDDFVVALPKSRIVSARPFDVELYQAMFEQGAQSRGGAFSRMWMPQALPKPITWVRPMRAPSTWRSPASPRRWVETS